MFFSVGGMLAAIGIGLGNSALELVTGGLTVTALETGGKAGFAARGAGLLLISKGDFEDGFVLYNLGNRIIKLTFDVIDSIDTAFGIGSLATMATVAAVKLVDELPDLAQGVLNFSSNVSAKFRNWRRMRSASPGARTHGNAHGHTVRDINPQGYTDNCGSCVIATDSTLAGAPASAVNTGRMKWEAIAKHFSSKWKSKNVQQASEELLDGGAGSRGVMGGFFKNADGAWDAHVFNIVNQGGTIRMLDGQIGRAVTDADLERYVGFIFLRTN
jgi:hypothetical protein